jgi:hypothetical protein
MSLISRVVKAAWDEVVKPESFVKGDEFEDYVRRFLFPADEYTLLQRTHDYQVNKKDFVESSKEPDFKFRSIKTGREFYIEAKYRSDYFDGGVEWCKPFQLRRYQDIDRDTPVYIVIGIGQAPGDPEKIFLLPLKEIKNPGLFRSFLKCFEIPPYTHAKL